MTGAPASIVLRDLCVDFPLLGTGDRNLQASPASDDQGKGVIQVRGGTRYVRALDHANLEINTGDRVGILGQNGSGKTTLLRTLNGVYAPTSGSLTVTGRVQPFLNIAFGMDEDASGYENMIIRGVMLGARPKFMYEKLDEIAEFTELGDFLNLPVRTYSTGMRMRLVFAVASSLPSDILLMDEWLSVGDVAFREKAKARLLERVDEAKILVIASHNESLLKQLCNRIVSIRAGIITELVG